MSTAVVPPTDLLRGTLQALSDGQTRIVDLLTKDALTAADLHELKTHGDAYKGVIKQFIEKTLPEITRQNIINAAPRRRTITREEIDAARKEAS